ncbi:LLM class flavin-dependent oxidoreductase [Actinoplanes siamensis]|uniref:N5,N10-methylene tetrahydromethanopterin reductase n=1 Tax=Actinoplanes siamensis TaxID=1223317 RepID=A0A919TM23_9ACTN|nr:LLM class flavin-dependent oxidoreductase [Actinoplanes siamensis]GIF07089.1 N5,N10-methylene tetrahydromethanopterin reductase [Actinoplanes siamensis]
MSLDIGVLLPNIGHLGNDLPGMADVARHAEEVGLDSVWSGDHLSMGGVPLLECTLTLAAAAAVTSRVRLGFSVMLVATRPAVWVARQLGTLQYLSGNRVEFGVGTGAKWAEEWHASGVPLTERGRRTDEFLRLLPDLLAGRPTKLLGMPAQPEVTLRPAVPVPPVWVGGRSERSLRRAAEHCTGWLTTISTPEEIRASADRLSVLAGQYGRPTPRVGTMIYARMAARPHADLAEQMARSLADAYRLPIEHTRQVVVGGDPEQTAEGLARHIEAGVDQFVVALEGADWREQYALLAEARARLV